MTLCLLLLTALLPGRLAPPDSLHPTSPDRRLAFAYANDFFFGTDYYFTQGITADLVSPALARLPTCHLLARGAAGGTSYFGVALHSDGFTPTSITDKHIRVGDRPYAAYFYASLYHVGLQGAKGQRLTSALEVGYIGPAAGGKPIQTKLHELTNNPTPQGWDYQIRSDAVLNYRLAYEQRLLAAGRWLELAGSTEASLGTLYTYASLGGRLRVGRFNSYFANLGGASPTTRAGLRRWQLYAEATGAANLVGHDATLQGGVFNRSSPYTLAFKEINHLVPHATAALAVAHDGLSFTATAVYVGPEFGGGRTHRWGVLALARAF